MKSITQNCIGLNFLTAKKRFQIISQAIATLQPDVVFLQEVMLKQTLGSITPPGYSAYYVMKRPIIRGGLVTLIRDDHQVVRMKFVKYTSQGKIYNKQIFDRIAGKGFFHITLDNNRHFINTHLLATYGKTDIIDHNQEKQLRQLLAYVQNLEKVIIGGDFNFGPQSDYYRLLRKYLHDVTPDKRLWNIYNKRVVDYIYSSEKDDKAFDVQFIDYHSRTDPSDHKGVFVHV